MQQILIVGAGGFVGAIARFVLSGQVQRRVPVEYLACGTFVVNAVGCLVIGVLMALVTERPLLPRSLQLLLVTGFLGSLTTFSAFGYETLELLRESRERAALLNIGANVVVGLLAVWVGRELVRLALAASMSPPG